MTLPGDNDNSPALAPAAARLERTLAPRPAALAAYLPAGYPTLGQGIAALQALAAHADVLEVGLPFSDPVMDGPTVAAAAATSLAAGFRTADLFTILSEVAATTTADLLVMTYWQPVHRWGAHRFAAALAEAGGAGVILPDLPVEEATTAWLPAAHAHGLHSIFVAAPNSSDARLTRVCGAGSGMVYAPATAGVTGSTGALHRGLPAFVKRLRTVTSLPVGVGIGVHTAAQAQEVGAYADAVIVGSALIRHLQQAPGARGRAAAAALAAELAAGVRGIARPAPTVAGTALSRSRLHCNHKEFHC